MSEPKPEQASPDGPDEAEIAAYLREHPDFLQRHPDVLDSLEVHHSAGGAISLIERQVASLRNGNRQVQGRLKELIDTARENELRVQYLNGLAQVLIRADSAENLVSGLREFLRRELSVDALFVGIAGGSEVAVGGIRAMPRDSAELAAVTNVFRRGKPICGPLTEDQIGALFAETGDTPPQSAAMVPLGKDRVRGALVLASRDSKRFVPEMGTLFLELLGELVTTACRRHLGPDKL